MGIFRKKIYDEFNHLSESVRLGIMVLVIGVCIFGWIKVMNYIDKIDLKKLELNEYYIENK